MCTTKSPIGSSFEISGRNDVLIGIDDVSQAANVVLSTKVTHQYTVPTKGTVFRSHASPFVGRFRAIQVIGSFIGRLSALTLRAVTIPWLESSVPSCMMSPEMKILLFGDQATDYHNNLRKKLHQKNSPVLSSFFDKTKAALREEVSLQSRLVRDTIPSFSNLLDLVDWSDEAKVANPAVESAICTTCQIACLIR